MVWYVCNDGIQVQQIHCSTALARSLVRLFSAVALIRMSSIERVGTAKARAGRPGAGPGTYAVLQNRLPVLSYRYCTYHVDLESRPSYVVVESNPKDLNSFFLQHFNSIIVRHSKQLSFFDLLCPLLLSFESLFHVDMMQPIQCQNLLG